MEVRMKGEMARGGSAMGHGGILDEHGAEHRHLLLLIPVVLRELTDFVPGGATGFGIFLGKRRKKFLELSGGATGRRNARRDESPPLFHASTPTPAELK
jgi:hypothetical protein